MPAGMGYGTVVPMDIGYARVSTTDQSLDMQIDALRGAGCERIYTETACGARDDRPELARMMDALRAGDVLTVYRLDRLGRSTRHLMGLVDGLAARGVQFRSLTERLDTTTPGGRLVFTVFAGIAQFERDLIRERTMAGLEAARLRGRRGGRPRKLTPGQVGELRRLHASREVGAAGLCRMYGISKTTLYRLLREDS